jgi:hypothetical protein
MGIEAGACGIMICGGVGRADSRIVCPRPGVCQAGACGWLPGIIPEGCIMEAMGICPEKSGDRGNDGCCGAG